MDRQLTEIGTIPVTTSIIESLYPELKSANKKVTWLEKQGFIIRLKRGLYVANPKHSGKTLSSELIANHLYTPSYISMSTALRYYGLIPEAVYVHQSMTVKHSRSFQTPIGCYNYKHISKIAFVTNNRLNCSINAVCASRTILTVHTSFVLSHESCASCCA